MSIPDYLTPDRVGYLRGRTKAEAIHEMAQRVHDSVKALDVATVERAILDRENLVSTGTVRGLALPEALSGRLTSPILAVGIHREGIADWETLDEKPVHVVMLTLVPPRRDENAEWPHRGFMSAFVALVKPFYAGDLVEALTECRESRSAYRLLTGTDAR